LHFRRAIRFDRISSFTFRVFSCASLYLALARSSASEWGNGDAGIEGTSWLPVRHRKPAVLDKTRDARNWRGKPGIVLFRYVERSADRFTGSDGEIEKRNGRGSA
jgi:hypothetical protein